MLPIAVAARAKGIKNLIIPASNAREAAVVEGVDVYPVRSLLEVRELLNSAVLGEITAAPLKWRTNVLSTRCRHFPFNLTKLAGRRCRTRGLGGAAACGPPYSLTGP